MDYWERLQVSRYVNYERFLEENPGARVWYGTRKAKRVYSDVVFLPGDSLMFGKESGGIPEEILAEHETQCIRIPMLEGTRSLNLSNSVAVVLYEALRQNGFADLEKEGKLHRLTWKEEDN